MSRFGTGWWLGGGPGFGNAITDLDSAIRALFANGEKGVWYDPSDLSSMFQDSAGTTPVTAVGQPVGKILDKSGRGNHATQATAAARPVLQQDGNGKYYLAFDGVDDFLSTASIDFSATDKMTVVAGVAITGTAVGTIAEFSTDASVHNGAWSYYQRTTSAAQTAFLLRGTDITLKQFTTGGTSRKEVASCAFDIAQASRDLEIAARINGAAQTMVTGGSASAGTGNFGNYPLYIGRRAGTSLPFKGNLNQLIVRGTASTAEQIVAGETFVNSKTGAY